MARSRKKASPPTPPPIAPTDLRLAQQITMRDVDDLIPYARNARTHSDIQIDQIAESYRRFGFTVPVLCDADGQLVAGHGRILAAKKIGLRQVPTIDVSYMSEEERRAYVILDNKLTLNGGWDEELLISELSELQVGGFDLGTIGFSIGELRGLGIGGLGEGGDAGQQTVPTAWAVIIDCVDEADQIALIERLQAEGRRVRGAVS